jgi:ubiquinone/menaquinone biosynthesis C-methylase UbiE
MSASISMTSRSADFASDYEIGRAPALRELERCILGCDYGGTSWTTRKEAERAARSLGLGAGTRLLDVGAGSGWPGLFLARASGCEVVLLDVPLVGLRLARDRALADGLAHRCHVVGGSGSALPFPDRSFDALSHSDVLCCTQAKAPMLRSCRRVARHGAKMAFSVISVTPLLAEPDRRIAVEAGPPFVEAPEDYSAMLAAAEWEVVERLDVTTEFSRALAASVAAMSSRAEALTAAMGAEEFSDRMRRRQAALAAVRAGLLKRECYLAQAR